MTQKAIALPFSFNQSGAVAYTIDEKKIWTDRVVLVLMTKLNERVMRPTFGSEVPSSVFETISGAKTLIQKSVASAFSRWLPSLELISVELTEENGELLADITYRYSPEGDEQSVRVKTAILSRSGEVLLEVNQ